MFAAAVLLSLVPNAGLSLGAERPSIIAREDWGAEPPTPGLKSHRPVSIVVHHTGVAQNTHRSFPEKLRNLQAYSQRELRWPDLPYHYYIDLRGSIAEGRDVRFTGDTNTNYDTRGHPSSSGGTF
jgi:hypothetical protein